MERGRQLEQPPTVLVLHGVQVHLADDQVDADHQVTQHNLLRLLTFFDFESIAMDYSHVSGYERDLIVIRREKL